MKILMIEDDKDINNMVTAFLTEKGCITEQAFSGIDGKMKLEQNTYDFVLIDLMLPGISGEELIRDYRAKIKAPIIVLTAKGSVDNKVQVLDCGADDYLTKPFDLNELWARIKVQMRHMSREMPAENFVYRKWQLDSESRVFTADGKEIDLTAHEFGIVQLLMSHPGKAFTKQEIFMNVWGEDYYVEDKTINVHISRIRAKLQETHTEDYIQTVWGIGFKLPSETVTLS